MNCFRVYRKLMQRAYYRDLPTLVKSCYYWPFIRANNVRDYVVMLLYRVLGQFCAEVITSAFTHK